MNALAVGREEVLVVGVEEGVGVAAEQRLVGVHPRPVLAEQRLGHERRVVAVGQRDLLDRDPVGHGVVRPWLRPSAKRMSISCCDGADLVVGVLHRDAEVAQGEDDVAAEVRGRRRAW
jgi:hypothetical protein